MKILAKSVLCLNVDLDSWSLFSWSFNPAEPIVWPMEQMRLRQIFDAFWWIGTNHQKCDILLQVINATMLETSKSIILLRDRAGMKVQSLNQGLVNGLNLS